ncbi:MAG TPA: response regulator [Salinivirga sp.]|uniref:Polar-differentiation response regulator DivK n=1 Tax=Salinivirga cyanobacteriivorans TaxID=1307839 RepID=A0A0S2HWU7_9BACT|nr:MULTISPECIES: response regulator [Salinivirga]ALO14482.1 Polar-differentiation response regulator DivK [Salinivirga cyanobacteriivorans]HKK57959.1 response regulator [Salinivirga sp.]
MEQLPWQDIDWKGRKILLAEDEEVNLIFFEELLEDTGVELVITADGQATVDAAAEHEDIDLILMDVKMPVMSGLDATRKIKASKPELPIIAQTAYAMEDEKQHCLDAGCDDYIAKPIDPNDLFTLLKKYMNK